MGVDALQRSSLAYRKARTEIWQGRIPAKYTRLLPHIAGNRIVELGAAEGVLSLLLAERGAHVVGVELRQERYEEAVKLQAQWRQMGRRVDGCAFICGDIRERLQILESADTLVAVRSIYYLRDEAQALIDAAYMSGVLSVVLCGNGNRAARHEHNPHDDLGRFNRLASVDGMTELLRSAGYSIATVAEHGDPIVVGTK